MGNFSVIYIHIHIRFVTSKELRYFAFQATVQHERRLKDIKPYLPPLEERAKIKADYLNSR